VQILFFGFCLYLDIVGAAKQVLFAPRDRMFTLCSALASAVLVFFACIQVPLTPKFTNVVASCETPAGVSEPDCVSVSEMLVVVMASALPLVLIALEFFACEHKLAYRNSYLELAWLIGFTVVYLVWGVLCSAINKVCVLLARSLVPP
jgi:hypothetical protein